MADISAIKAMLEAKLQELDARAHEIDDALSEPGDPDWSDGATEAEDDEVQEKVGNLAVAEITKIKAALSRIDSGRYGKCETCSQIISQKRLEALPYATKCINCASDN